MLLASFKELLGHLNSLGLLWWEGTPPKARESTVRSKAPWQLPRGRWFESTQGR